jgi:hypothetical protein
LAGLKESAPAAEKGFSMLTVALKKKMDVQRAHDKKVAAAVARRSAGDGGSIGAKVIPIATRAKRQTNATAVVQRNAGDGGSIEEGSLHSTTRLLRRSEAKKKMHRAVPVGMTGFARGASRAKIKSAKTKRTTKKRAAKKPGTKSGKKSGAKRKRG